MAGVVRNSMLELLGDELLGGVLQRAAPADLRAARQASKLMDSASRYHLDAAANLNLTPPNTANGFPRFSRFPRLQRITFLRWDIEEADTAQLRTRITDAFVDTLPEHLAGVLEVCVWSSSNTLSPALPLLLRTRLCSVTGLVCRGVKPWIDLNMLAANLMGAPNLERLCVYVDHLSDRAADVLTTLAPRLKSLTIGYRGCSCTTKTMHMIAGRMGQLTQLQCTKPTGCGRLPFDVATDIGRLQQLRVLRGVMLPFDCVETLARGLPQLRVSEASPTGIWGVTLAVFQSLSYLRVRGTNASGFRRLPDLSNMLSSLQQLVVDMTSTNAQPGGLPDYHVPLAGLTGLQSKAQLRMFGQHWPLAAGQWDAIAAMPNLQHLSCAIRAGEVAQLQGLANRGLRTFEVVILGDAAFDLGAALVAIGCSFPCLAALGVDFVTPEASTRLSHGELFTFVHSLPLLETFILDCPGLTCSHACTLAMHGSLRELAFPSLKATDELRQVAAEHAARGMRMIVDRAVPLVFNSNPPSDLLD